MCHPELNFRISRFHIQYGMTRLSEFTTQKVEFSNIHSTIPSIVWEYDTEENFGHSIKWKLFRWNRTFHGRKRNSWRESYRKSIPFSRCMIYLYFSYEKRENCLVEQIEYERMEILIRYCRIILESKSIVASYQNFLSSFHMWDFLLGNCE